jgi:hypothetical protein
MPAVRDLLLNLKERREGNALLTAANDLDRLAHGADASGDAFKRMRSDAARLNLEIDKTKARIKDLHVQFARTNDKGLLGDIRSAEKDLRQLEKTLKAITPSMETVGKGFNIPGPGKGALVAAGVAALPAVPAIGAMVGGAIAGATGTAALAAGILSAAKSEEVRSAASEAGHSIADAFFAGGQAFVEPTVDAIHTIEQAFNDIHISDALAKVAPEVRVIAGGFADFARNIMPGFNKALDRMGPYADVAARGIADMGDAIGDFLDEVTASPGTVQGLETLFYGLNSTVRIVGESIHFLSDRFHNMLDNSALLSGWMEDWYPSWYPLHGIFANINDEAERMLGIDGSLHGTISRLNKDAVDPFTKLLRDAWQQMDQLRGETEATRNSLVDYFNTLKGQLDADLAWEQAIDDLTQSFVENGNSLDIHTEKGRKNIRAVEDGLDAAREQYRQGKLTNEQYDAEIQRLIDIGVKAGASRKALEGLAKPYEIQVFVNIVGTQIQSGMARVLGNAVQNLFGHTAAAAPSNRRESFAAGGVTPAFQPFEVHSGEMLWSNREHYVSTAAQTNALMSGASGGSASPVVISFAATGDALLDAILRELKKYIRVNGGTGSDSVQTALGY